MAELQEYKCPCCGGGIAFDSSLQKMKCPYCDTEFEMDTLLKYDSTLKQTEAADDMKWQTSGTEWSEGETDGMRYYVCKSCGGEIIGDESLAATLCPYCSNPIVMMGQYTGKLKPDYVLPFKLDKKAAEQALQKHLMDKKFLPKSFRDTNHLKEVRGMYVPFWLFDADADAAIKYRGVTMEHWVDSSYSYTRTNFFDLTRQGTLSFKGVPADGSKKMADDVMESLEPFNYEDLKPFQTAYLAGYMADRYDVSSEESVERANARVKASTEAAIRNTIQGYMNITTQSSSVQLHNGQARYALMPVWILHTRWNNTDYNFMMNGQTGKFVGNLPYDKSLGRKFFWKRFAIVAAIAMAILSAIYFFM